MNRAMRGFTLIETMAVLLVLSVLSIGAFRFSQQTVVDNVVASAAKDVEDFSGAVYRYRLATGGWPASPAVLVPTYLHADDLTTAFDLGYTFTLAGPDMIISFDALENRFALPLSGSVRRGTLVGTVISSRLVPPGAEASLLSKYSRDGSLALTGALAGGNQDANDLNVINANQFVDRAGGVLDPSGNSTLLGNLSVGGDITVGDDVTVADRLTANEAFVRRITDSDNNLYGWDGSGTTRQNETWTDRLRILANDTAGSACASTDSLGLTSTGQLLTCQSGTWRSSGGYGTTALWSGALNGNYQSAFMSEPITNFDQVLIEAYNEGSGNPRIHHFMDVGSIVYGVTYSIDATPVVRSQTNQTIEIRWLSSTRMYVNLTDGDAAIRSVRGISYGG